MSEPIPHAMNQIYTPLGEAVRLLEKRKTDKKLVAKVIEYLGADVIDEIPFIKDEIVAILFSHIATPNIEHELFIQQAQAINIKPIFWEYFDDKFVSKNYVKYTLGKLHVFKNSDEVGGQRIEKHTIIDFNKSNGRKIREIETVDGESLVGFHHKLFLRQFPYLHESFFDSSNVLHKWGKDAKDYYVKFLSLFVCFGILFETIVPSDPIEEPFLIDILMPAIKEVSALFGIDPIIVRTLPAASEGEEFWYFYSSKNFQGDPPASIDRQKKC